MKAVILKKSQEKNGPGYNLGIQDFRISLQDLLVEVNRFIEIGDLPRLWPKKVNKCEGCHLCCHEPLPITIIDLINICQTLEVDFVQAFRYLNLEVDGNVVDITLKRRKGNCVFLDHQGRCRIYDYRPFLCQTYICCHMHPAIEELRSQVVNQGMDELIRQAILQFRKNGKPLPVNHGTARNVRLSDWPSTCFSGKQAYSEIYLENVLSSDLKKVLLV